MENVCIQSDTAIAIQLNVRHVIQKQPVFTYRIASRLEMPTAIEMNAPITDRNHFKYMNELHHYDGCKEGLEKHPKAVKHLRHRASLIHVN